MRRWFSGLAAVVALASLSGCDVSGGCQFAPGGSTCLSDQELTAVNTLNGAADKLLALPGVQADIEWNTTAAAGSSSTAMRRTASTGTGKYRFTPDEAYETVMNGEDGTWATRRVGDRTYIKHPKAVIRGEHPWLLLPPAKLGEYRDQDATGAQQARMMSAGMIARMIKVATTDTDAPVQEGRDPVGGVPATRYLLGFTVKGSNEFVEAWAIGSNAAKIRVWVDDQQQIRQLELTVSGTSPYFGLGKLNAKAVLKFRDFGAPPEITHIDGVRQLGKG